MDFESIKPKLVRLMAFVVGGAAFLWALWFFGMSDSLTTGMSPVAKHTLEVFVSIGVTALALLGPSAALMKMLMEDWKEIEIQAEKNATRYRTIVENSYDIILEVDEEGKIFFANPAVSQLGYERENLLGKSLKSLIPEKDHETKLPPITTRRIGPRATINFPVTLLTNDDSVLSYEVPSMEFLVDASGLWKESDEVVRIKGSEKTFIGTLFIARTKSDN
ncbi:MAG: PAS domain S-box protein [Candidatus Nitronauta litoralis]|uniref:PAS domain S-box protein n=1 Tax=Candidatus Nitronauta litoralis TaxID=2705533 RepID=A0A7T0BTC9_9BACT|nr:MAG: PAS domain S-box protein [Candidatus Nitronauta litoralis]